MFEIIKQDVFTYFFMYIRQGSRIAAVVFCLSFVVYGCYAKKCGDKCFSCGKVCFKAFVMALLVLYVYYVIGITLLSRMGQYVMHVNLHLFSTFDSTVVEPRYIYENLLLFMPFGILLHLLGGPFRNGWVILLIGFLCSLAIEVAQLVTGLGCFIVDDILTNTIGMMAAYLLFRLLEIGYQQIRES